MSPQQTPTFVPIDFTTFQFERLENFPPHLHIAQVKYIVRKELVQRKIRPREPLMPDELQQKRLNERIVERYPFVEDFLQELNQDLDEYPIFVTYTDESAEILTKYDVSFVNLRNSVLSSAAGLAFGSNANYELILKCLQPIQSGKLKKPREVTFSQVNFTDMQRMVSFSAEDVPSPPASEDQIYVINEIVNILLTDDRFRERFYKIVFELTNRLLSIQKMEEVENPVIYVESDRCLPVEELLEKFNILQMDILDVRHCFPNETYIKLNQRANAEEILQKMREKLQVRPELDKLFPAMPTEVLIEISEDNIELCKKIYFNMRKIAEPDPAHILELYKLVEIGNKPEEKLAHRFLHFEMSSGRDQWRETIQTGMYMTSKDEWDILRRSGKIREIQVSDEVRGSLITVHSTSQCCKSIVCVRIEIDAHIKEITGLLRDIGVSELLAWEFHSPFSVGQGPIRLFENIAILMTQDQDAANIMVREIGDKTFRRKPLSPSIVSDSELREYVKNYTQINYLQVSQRPVYLVQYKSRNDTFEFEGEGQSRQNSDIIQVQFKDEDSANQAVMMLKKKGIEEVVRINYD